MTFPLCYLIGPALEREAGHLNQTTKEEPDAAIQTGLLDELASMLDSIRAADLKAANTTAHQELRCV